MRSAWSSIIKKPWPASRLNINHSRLKRRSWLRREDTCKQRKKTFITKFSNFCRRLMITKSLIRNSTSTTRSVFRSLRGTLQRSRQWWIMGMQLVGWPDRQAVVGWFLGKDWAAEGTVNTHSCSLRKVLFHSFQTKTWGNTLLAFRLSTINKPRLLTLLILTL